MKCPKCQHERDAAAKFCPNCGQGLAGAAAGVAQEGDATGGVIPYKNPKALMAYYFGLFSCFPGLGLLLGIAAVVLGVRGLRDRKANPAIKGSVHAGIGIGCGGFFVLVWIAVIVLIIIAIVQQN